MTFQEIADVIKEKETICDHSYSPLHNSFTKILYENYMTLLYDPIDLTSREHLDNYYQDLVNSEFKTYYETEVKQFLLKTASVKYKLELLETLINHYLNLGPGGEYKNLIKGYFKDYKIQKKLKDGWMSETKYTTLENTVCRSLYIMVEALKKEVEYINNQNENIRTAPISNNLQVVNENNTEENSTAYKVWMLQKLRVLATLNDTYLEKNPNSKRDDFAKLIINIIGVSDTKLVSVKRYITAALNNEEILTDKLKDQLSKTLNEHNLG